MYISISAILVNWTGHPSRTRSGREDGRGVLWTRCWEGGRGGGPKRGPRRQHDDSSVSGEGLWRGTGVTLSPHELLTSLLQATHTLPMVRPRNELQLHNRYTHSITHTNVLLSMTCNCFMGKTSIVIIIIITNMLLYVSSPIEWIVLLLLLFPLTHPLMTPLKLIQDRTKVQTNTMTTSSSTDRFIKRYPQVGRLNSKLTTQTQTQHKKEKSVLRLFPDVLKDLIINQTFICFRNKV